MGQPMYWDGLNLLKKGSTVDIDPKVVKVARGSAALKPVGDSPVFERVGDKLVEYKAPKGG
jgi:hypothetical protein